jgi:alpha-D-xyloside xylohydrolase
MVANAFSLMHAKGIYENQPQKPVINLTRAGWAGIQKYGVILWAGDTSANWEELRREIAKGINISISGVPYWTVDAGAFFLKMGPHLWFLRGNFDDGINDKGYQELYTRWLQFACFLPVFRSHGTDAPREVWNFDEPFRSAIEGAIRLRYRLIPYIKEAYRKIHENDYTLMRGFIFDFPNDKKAITISNEFMFGSDILVCPIYEPQLYGPKNTPIEKTNFVRECYLPSGCDWYDFYTNEFYRGGQTVKIETVIDRIPVFIKAGATIPITDDAKEYADANYTVKNLHYPKK